MDESRSEMEREIAKEIEKEVELVSVLYISSVIIPVAIRVNIISFAYIGLSLLLIGCAIYISQSEKNND